MEIKEATLRLFLKHVIVSFNDNSTSYKTYGQSLIGILSGRNWGKDAIISISIKKGEREFIIPAVDIENIEAL